MGKRYNQSDNQKYQQFDDEFENFGYDVKNIRRQTKKKVTKFKREVDEYYDTYWIVHYHLISHPDRVLYTCSGFFMFYTGHNGTLLSTLSCYELVELSNNKPKDPCSMALETDKKIMNLFEEMFGDESDTDQPEYEVEFDIDYTTQS